MRHHAILWGEGRRHVLLWRLRVAEAKHEEVVKGMRGVI